MLLTSILSALLLWSGASAQVSTKSLVTCLTKQGAKPTSPVRTTSKILTIPWYAYGVVTSTPSVTTTPATSTQIESSTTTILFTTTLPVETDTRTETATITYTNVVTSTTTTISEVRSTTSVTTTPTTTIAASAGFIPIETSIPGTMKRRAADPAAEHALGERQAPAGIRITAKNGNIVCDPPVYPQSVQCVGLVALITTLVQTKTARSTRTVAAPTPIVTSTTVFTTSSTVTVTPARESTTLTVTTVASTEPTVTATETSLTTVSVTIAYIAPQATFYAACAENNIVDSIDGQGIESITLLGSFTVVEARSAYDCCAACINTAGCSGSIFSLKSQVVCYLSSNSPSRTCSQSYEGIYLFKGSSRNFAVSNGYCGSVARAN